MATKKEEKRKFAVFDIDGTIFRSSLLIELVRHFIAEGVFPARAARTYDAYEKKWLDREGSYDEYIMAVVHAFRRHIKGVPETELISAGRTVVNALGNRTYVYTRSLITDLRKQGYFLIAISQSPKRVLDPFCGRLGFDAVYGRIYEVDLKDKFTGETAHEEIISKKERALERVVAKYNLTLRDSIAVGDTEDDIPMLAMVERPICFNPNKKLYLHAKKMKWRVVVERKNVVYEI